MLRLQCKNILKNNNLSITKNRLNVLNLFLSNKTALSLKSINTSLKKIDEAVKAIGNKTGTGPPLFYDPIKDIAGSVDGAFYNQIDKNWAKAALTIYDFYRGLGGEAHQKTIYFRECVKWSS